jgi:hypothetical protein
MNRREYALGTAVNVVFWALVVLLIAGLKH